MADRTYGGSRKISINSRPRSGSKSRRPARRRHTPTSNAIVFSSEATPKYRSTTNFSLFSNNLVAKKPPTTQAAKLAQVSARNQQLVSHAPRTRAQVRAIRSPTPVEEPPLPVTSSHVRRSSATSEPVKPNVLVVTEGPVSTDFSQDNCSEASPRSLCYSYTSSYKEVDYNPDVFPFEYLPDDCKLKVFSFLSIHDKGRCAQVCLHWNSLMKTSNVWSHVAFSDFPFWCITTDEHNCIGNCYIRFRVRVKQFLSYLKELRPKMHSLEFKFDIGEKADGFLQPLENLIDKANTKELKYASMNWKETPQRPFWTDSARDVRCDEVMQKHRLRQRLFVSFFDMFTLQCPKVETLVVPFDWSDKSVDCLLRLQGLRSLVLEKYFVFQKLCQDLIDRLLIGLPCLQQLMLEVWTPSGHGLVFFGLVSKSIEYLDISQSRGFYLNTVHLPKLKTFRVARHPWNGPLVLADRVNVPCIYDVLAEGSPKLEKINEHHLEATWRDGIYQTLEEVLRSVCSCRRHKSGWAM